MKIYLKRIQKEILPFILIGLLTKLLFLFQGDLLRWKWMKSYFRYADISLSLKLRSFQLFGEYIAPVTIAYCLIFLYLSAALHRLIIGRTGEGGSFFVNKIILPIEEFASLLSIATLGLLIGISLGSIVNGPEAAVSFLVFGLYPVFFLLLLAIGVGFVVVQNKTVCTGWMQGHLPGFICSRMDGLYLLALFFVTITFHNKIDEQIRMIGKWLLRQL
ncbi:MAG: hypothetical protein C4522_12955 [Desulfobacteraceae bacterium]|nr:MAG: hypothetical protein C4522_12955 [Desulfobacteraceae bacterium]